ncbi:MAG: hypothetical protein SPH91_07435 [Lachnospiraceae bacterium]|nr:hypothetical protein [Lachnospiraceae bacterium]
MKNKTVNKKVLRAMSIGLAAMMTVQPILATPVFADDTEPVDDAGSSVEATAESSSAETTTESTSAPAPTVENVTQSYTEASTATGEIKASLDQAVSAGRDSDEFAGFDQNNGGELTNLYNAVVGTEIGAEIGAVDPETLKDDRTEISDAAIKLVEDAKRDDEKFDVDADELLKNQVNTDINNIVTAENNLNNAINAQDTALDELNKKIEITNDFTGTDGLINLETGNIENATSIPAATDSLGAATALKDGADKKFKDSEAAYKEADSKYKAAKAELDKKQQAYNKALNDAVADDSADKKSALIKAKNELETAQTDCYNLLTEINQAQDALSNSAIGKLASALAKTKENANDWSSLDLIMKDVIQYYYFPSIGVNAADVVIDAQFTKNSALADGTKNERANYIKATVNGKVYYLNYICEKDGTPDNKINNDGRYPKMVIFEKNPELLGHHYEVEGTDTEYDSDDVENKENQVTLEFIKDNTSTDSIGKFIINDGTTYHIDSKGTVTEVTAGDMSGVTSNEAGKSGSYISKVEKGETSTVIKDGVLTVKTEGSITTTTFVSGNTLDDIESSESVSSYNDAVTAAEAARNAAVNNALAEGHTLQKDENGNDIISSDTTISADVTAEAEVEYRTKFVTTIDLTGLTAGYDSKWYDFDLAEDEEKKELANAIDDVVNNIRNYIMSNYDYDKEELGGKVSNLSIDRNAKLFRDNRFEIKSGTVTFTYYSKVNTVEGEATDSTQTALSGDASTEKAKADAKTDAITNVIMDDAVSSDDISDLISGHTGVGNEIHWIPTYNLNPFSGHFGEITGYLINETYEAKFGTLAASNVTTVSSLVDKNKGTLTDEDATVKGTPEIKYSYSVSNIKYADQYDTVEDEQTIYSKNLNLSALTSVDDYAAIPLLNDNYYNYKNGKSTNGILADLRKTDSDIYKNLMKDVENANKLAAKYEDAWNKAVQAKGKVEDAQKEVKALIDSINALKNVSGSEYEKKLAGLEKKLAEALENLNKATDEKKAVDEAYGRALAAYEDAVARLTPAPATGDEETAPTAGGGTTTAPAPAVVTTLAGTPVFALPAGGVAAPAAGVAGVRTSRGAAIDSDSATADTEDTTAKIAPTKEVEEDALAITKDTIKTIKDNETPLSSLAEDSTQKMNWWWLLLIALLGATGEEIYRRNKKKKEEEAALKAEIDKE